jgi:hypothetical protein
MIYHSVLLVEDVAVDADISERGNMVFTSSLVSSGHGLCLVTSIGLLTGQLLAVLCCAVLCCAVLCCAVLCCAVLCCAVLCCAVLYSTLLHSTPLFL